MQLDNDLCNITMVDLSVLTYCSKIQNLVFLIRNLNVDSKVQYKHLVNYVINSLSTRFKYISVIILHSKPLPSFQEMQSTFLLEETLLVPRNTTSQPHADHSSSPSILHASSTETQRNLFCQDN